MGLVFIGLKNFAASTYPTGVPDSFYVDVGGFGYSGAAVAHADSLTSTYAQLVDGLKSTTATGSLLNIYDYNGKTTSKMGHAFCGFTSIVGSAIVHLDLFIDAATSPNIKPKVKEVDSGASSYSAAACLFVATKASCVNDEKQSVSPTATTSASTGVVVTNNFLTPTIT